MKSHQKRVCWSQVWCSFLGPAVGIIMMVFCIGQFYFETYKDKAFEQLWNLYTVGYPRS